MTSDREQQHRRVKWFVRADPELGCEAQKQSVLDRLTELESAGHVDEYDVHVWTRVIRPSGPLQETDYYRTIFSHLEDFQRWADEHSVSLEFAFKRKTLTCEITGERYTVLSLPSMCLAIYEGDELCGVYPHRNGDGLSTIAGCLSELESDAEIVVESE